MTAPIEVNDGTAATLLITGVRQLALIASGGMTMLAYARDRDLAGLADWVQGDTFATFAIAAAGVGTFAYGQYRTWRNKRQTIKLAHAAPDRIAIVK